MPVAMTSDQLLELNARFTTTSNNIAAVIDKYTQYLKRPRIKLATVEKIYSKAEKLNKILTGEMMQLAEKLNKLAELVAIQEKCTELTTTAADLMEKLDAAEQTSPVLTIDSKHAAAETSKAIVPASPTATPIPTALVPVTPGAVVTLDPNADIKATLLAMHNELAEEKRQRQILEMEVRELKTEVRAEKVYRQQQQEFFKANPLAHTIYLDLVRELNAKFSNSLSFSASSQKLQASDKFTGMMNAAASGLNLVTVVGGSAVAYIANRAYNYSQIKKDYRVVDTCASRPDQASYVFDRVAYKLCVEYKDGFTHLKEDGIKKFITYVTEQVKTFLKNHGAEISNYSIDEKINALFKIITVIPDLNPSKFGPAKLETKEKFKKPLLVADFFRHKFVTCVSDNQAIISPASEARTRRQSVHLNSLARPKTAPAATSNGANFKAHVEAKVHALKTKNGIALPGCVNGHTATVMHQNGVKHSPRETAAAKTNGRTSPQHSRKSSKNFSGKSVAAHITKFNGIGAVAAPKHVTPPKLTTTKHVPKQAWAPKPI